MKRYNRRHNNKSLRNRTAAFAAALLLAATGCLPLAAAAQNGKEENVYVNLLTDGSVDEIYVVNTFYLPEDGAVTDYGRYKTVKNMVSDQDIAVSRDTVSADAAEGHFSYQGTLKKKELPWNIGIRYTLNGREVQADTLPGANGTLKMTIAVEENSGGQDTFYNNFLMRITVTLDMNRCSNISSPGATVENAGLDKKLIYYVLPGTEKTVDITADVVDFAMSPVVFDAVAASLEASEGNTDGEMKDISEEMEELAARFQDDADTLTNNSSALESGIEGFKSSSGTLKAGMDEYNSGAEKLGEGIDSLKDGTGELADGAGSLHDGLVAVQEGISNLADSYQGDDGAVAGARKLADGAGKLSDGAGAVNKGVDSMVTAMTSMTALAEKQIDAQVPDRLWEAAAALGITDIPGDTAKAKLGYVKLRLSGNDPVNVGGLIKTAQDAKIELFKQLGAAAASPHSGAGTPENEDKSKEKSNKTKPSGDSSMTESDQDETKSGESESAAGDADSNESLEEQTDTEQTDTDQTDTDQTDTDQPDKEQQTPESEPETLTENVPQPRQTEKESEVKTTVPVIWNRLDGQKDSAQSNADIRQTRVHVLRGMGSTYGTYETYEQTGKIRNRKTDQSAYAAVAVSSTGTAAAGPLPDLIAKLVELDTALTGMYQLNTQVESLLSMYAILESIGAQIPASQLQDLKTGVGQLTDGVKGLSDGANALAGGLSQLSDGTGQLSGGMSEVVNGSSDLADGVTDLRDGTDSLAEGYEILTDASGGLTDGSGQLSEGTGSLSDTVKDLTDSARQLAESSQDMIDKAQDMGQKAESGENSTISAAADSWQPVSFVSDKNLQVSNVQFSMQTPPVKVEQAAFVPPAEPKKSFWEKLVSLFSFD